MSEPSNGDAFECRPSLGRRAADLFVFAPAGLVATVIEEIPGLVDKGRARVEVPIRNARFLGQIAVAQGRRDLTAKVGRLLIRGRPTRAGTTKGGGDDRSQAATPTKTVFGSDERDPQISPAVPPDEPSPDDRTEGHEARREHPHVPLTGAVGHSPMSDEQAVKSAIAGYDTLSASQVVRRLDGLGPAELQTILRYETATRGRRTILHRSRQLLGIEELPGAPGPGS